jgi:putative endonuclease
MFTVYVLRSDINHRLYVGQTNNLSRRLFEHNSGHSTYTKLTKPFRLIYQENFTTRMEAIAREIELKTGKGREWLKMILADG